MRAEVYLVFTSQNQARSSILSSSASAADAQVFKSIFNTVINKDYSISVDTYRYQSMLEHALLKENFSIGTVICILPSNLDLRMRQTAGYNNKILISNIDLKMDSNKNVNRT